MTQLPDWRNTRVVVLGDAMLDTYLSGDVDRVSPEAPVPVVRLHEAGESRLGGAANVAANLVALGAKAHLVAAVGGDWQGDRLRALLIERRVRDTLLPLRAGRTLEKARVVAHGQQLLRMDRESQVPAADAATLAGWAAEALDGAAAVIVSDYGRGACAAAGTLIEAARAAHVPVVVDPKGVRWSRYAGATVLTPNQAELAAEYTHCGGEAASDVMTRAEHVMGVAGIDAMLVTQGARGMSLLVNPRGHATEYQRARLLAKAREVADVTGAGDTVVALLALGLASQLALLDAARMANRGAGLVVAKRGTAIISSAELQAEMLPSTPPRQGALVLERSHAEHWCRQHALAGRRVVLANGCFDVLHDGHLRLLDEAAHLGDAVIVAVNDDDSVRAAKGAGRPTRPLADRMRALASLRTVDAVTHFGEPTPEALIRVLKPDVLIKGGDYDAADVVGREFVMARGGRVHIVPLVEGLSTTAIIAGGLAA